MELRLHIHSGWRRARVFLAIFVSCYLAYLGVSWFLAEGFDPGSLLAGLPLATLVAGIGWLKESREVERMILARAVERMPCGGPVVSECAVREGRLRIVRGDSVNERPLGDISRIALQRGRLTLRFRNRDFLALPPQAFESRRHRAEFARKLMGR